MPDDGASTHHGSCADRNTGQNVPPQADLTITADTRCASRRRIRSDVREITNFDIVLDDGRRINNRAATNAHIGIHNRSGEHHRPCANRGGCSDRRIGVDDCQYLDPFFGALLHQAAPRLIVTDAQSDGRPPLPAFLKEPILVG